MCACFGVLVSGFGFRVWQENKHTRMCIFPKKGSLEIEIRIFLECLIWLLVSGFGFRVSGFGFRVSVREKAKR